MRGRKRAHCGQINTVGEGLSDYLFDHLVVEIVLKHMVDLENPGITIQGTGGAEVNNALGQLVGAGKVLRERQGGANDTNAGDNEWVVAGNLGCLALGGGYVKDHRFIVDQGVYNFIHVMSWHFRPYRREIDRSVLNSRQISLEL